MTIVRVSSLKKIYWDKCVLDSIDLSIDRWEIFWLLGHNWAWKTTLIWILTDLVKKTEWEIIIDWNNIDKNFLEAKKIIWLVPQEFNFDVFMKVREVPIMQASLYWIDKSTANERMEYLLKRLELWDHKEKPIRTLSWWMKRRLMIVRALMHSPKLFILDEPTAWVDVELRKEMWKFILELKKSWTTILLTTHYIEEAEQLCDRIAIISKGKIVENSPKNELLAKLKYQTILVETDKDINSANFENNDFHRCEFTWSKSLEIEYDTNKLCINDIVKTIDSQWYKITNITNKISRLEQLFIDITNENLWTE